MRVKYYRLSLRQMKKEKSFVFFFVFLIVFSSITTLYIRVIKPTLIEFTKSHGYTLAMQCTETAIRQNIQDLDYNSIVKCETDKNGNLVAIQTNTKELNEIANNVALDVENNISKLDNTSIKIPIALFFDLGIFGGAGIRASIKTVPLGDTKIDFISQFDSVGINQTRHRIILKVKTNFTILAPVYLKNQCYEREVVFAETILNGDIPETYYNLNLKSEDDLMEVM